MKRRVRELLVFCFAAGTIGASIAQATTYNVNRSFTDEFLHLTAHLTGTLDIPIGNYTIQNAGASPFTGVNLTVTVNSTPHNLFNTLTDLISGTGQFLISANPTSLTFSTANADSFNTADLVFSDNNQLYGGNQYVIGSDGNPAFQAATTYTGNPVGDATFPTIFGIAVPAGDYNHNGIVDAADYVLWRNGDSPDSTQAGYNLWKANFGNTAGSGAALSVIPEPSTLLLTVAALAALSTRRRKL